MSSTNGTTSSQSDDEVNSSLMRLLNRMVQEYGFFQPSSPVASTGTPFVDNNATYPDDTIEDMHKFKARKTSERLSTQSSTLVFAKLGSSTNVDDETCCAMTTNHLQTQIEECLLKRGRMPFRDLADEFHVDMENIKDAAEMLCSEKREDGDDNVSANYIVGMDLVNGRYLNKMCQMLVQEMSDVKCAQDIAHEWNLPLQFTIDVLERRVTEGGFFDGMKLIENGDGTKQMVTRLHEGKMLAALDDLLQNAKVPLKLSDVVLKVASLEPRQILAHIKAQCETNIYAGTLHQESISSAMTTNLSAMYVPDVYEHEQESKIIAFFDTNGYVTLRHGDNVGLSKKRLMECILKHNPRAIPLDQCMINPDVFVTPVQAAIEECIESESFLDLSQYIPEQMTVADCTHLIQDYIFVDGDRLGCLIFLVDKEPFYFSQGMVKHISTKLLRPLIEDYAKSCAQEVVDKAGNVYNDHVEDGEQQGGKKSSKGRNRAKNVSGSENVSHGILPIASLADAIAKGYPDLAGFQSSYVVEKEDLCWDIEDGGSDGPLYAFCRAIFGTSRAFQKDCDRAVNAEIVKLTAMKKGMSIGSNGAANVKNIEAVFEKSFKISCHFLLMLAKYPKALLGEEETEAKDDAEAMFLNTAAADLTRRLTEFCLFKNGVQNGLFHFFHEGDGDDSDESNLFYNEINSSSKRTFKRVFLSCPSDNGSDQIDPLQLLRDSLPVGVGVPLARMWIFCGGTNYSGGERMQEDGNRTFRPGDFEEFLSHAEEYCLSMCGLPFKVLDKKSDKQMLFSRKKELQSQLQEIKSDREIIEVSLILLFQRIKGMIICNVTTNKALDVLCCDKKVPSSIAELLKKVKKTLDNGTVEGGAVQVLKQLALCKDLSNIQS